MLEWDEEDGTVVVRRVGQFTSEDIHAALFATDVPRTRSIEALAVQDPETVATALANFRAKPALGFSACLVLEIARKAGHLPLATFDKALSKLEGAQRL